MALAGTLPHNPEEEYHWGDKEITEQGWVKETLERDLQDLFSSSVVKCSETFTRRAGNLVHLCNELSVEAQNINTTLLLKLHPTPAVGGIPVDEGMRFLADHENFDRAYYTGFFGPLMGEDQIDLFVNLRCAQIISEGLVLYVGAGITTANLKKSGRKHKTNPKPYWPPFNVFERFNPFAFCIFVKR